MQTKTQTMQTQIRRLHCQLILFYKDSLPSKIRKGALTRYGKLTWESAHAWNLIILCLLFVAVFLGCTSTGRVGLCFLWFVVQDLQRAQQAVVLVLKRLRRRGNGLKSHPTDWVIILCLLIDWGMTFIFMVHLSFYAIPLLIYDVMYDISTTH